MSIALEKYLDRVMIYANRSEKEATKIRAELEDHLLKKITDLEEQGLPREDAIFQAIEDHGLPRTIGYGLRPKFPWLDVRTHGTARGFIAIGPKAIGIIAIGGMTAGIISCGGISVGLLGFGGLCAALFFAWAGVAFAPMGIAYGGVALGLVAFGGFALGVIASGGCAAGLWVPGGGQTFSLYSMDTLPGFLHFLKGWLSFHNQASYQKFINTYLLVNLVIVSIFAFLMTSQGVLMARERRRLKRLDASLIE